MSEFRYEREMYGPVTRWLDQEGYVWAKQTCTPSYLQCDLAAGRFAEKTGRTIPTLLDSMMIELKLDDVSTAIKQAQHYANFVTFAYVAMPMSRCERMRDPTLDRFEAARIGLLGVAADGAVREYVVPFRGVGTHEMVRKNLWRRRNTRERRPNRFTRAATRKAYDAEQELRTWK